jgi:CSLREA domain-containing protein
MNFLRPAIIALLALAALLVVVAASGSRPAYAATFTVDSTADVVDAIPGDGTCATAGGDCTLRAAIQETNALAGADTVNLPSDTYSLTIPGADEDAAATGDLDITDDLTITGADAATTIIDGRSRDRVFHISPLSIGTAAQISGVTIRNGREVYGGHVGFDGSGGGIHNSRGDLTLADSTVTENWADLGGGGITNSGSSATLTNVTVSGNPAAAGGGVHNNGTLTMTNVTVSGNSATEVGTGYGGGIFNEFAGGALTNVTVSGNTAASGGGGISNIQGSITLTNVTLSGNTAPYYGGGISNFGDLTLANAIVANSSSGGDCYGIVISAGHNLDSDSTCGLAAVGDLPNTDPLLGPLQDNGGLTFTHALLPTSPAIDAGDDTACPATDQRGAVRPQGAACDIGAYEFGPDFDGDRVLDATESACGSDSMDANSVPERINGVDDDGNEGTDEVQEPVTGADCDGDGYDDDIEATLVTGHQARCADTGAGDDEADDQWPADFNDNGRLNLQDVNSFNVPVKHFGQPAVGHERWNLAGGADINIQDVNSLNTLAPQMFDGEKAFGNTMYGLAGTCPVD